MCESFQSDGRIRTFLDERILPFICWNPIHRGRLFNNEHIHRCRATLWYTSIHLSLEFCFSALLPYLQILTGYNTFRIAYHVRFTRKVQDLLKHMNWGRCVGRAVFIAYSIYIEVYASLYFYSTSFLFSTYLILECCITFPGTWVYAHISIIWVA